MTFIWLTLLITTIGFCLWISSSENFISNFRINNQKLVALDIDDTLFINSNTANCDQSNIIIQGQFINKYAIDIIKECVKKGYLIGIVTARPRIGAEIAAPIIKEIFDIYGYNYDDYFFNIGHPKSAFQYGFVFNKQYGMEKLQNLYGLTRNNMILFDDMQNHIINCINNGFLAQKSCDDIVCPCGITEQSKYDGMKKLN